MKRNLVQKVLESEGPTAKISGLSNDGYISFTVDLGSMGLKSSDFEADPLYVSQFFVNFIGEYFVRQNISEFSDVLVKIPALAYEDVVFSFDHVDFGMNINSEKEIEFAFHISLVQSVMTEELKKIVALKN